jgi:predicted N-acetyltransferase YhbS
MKTALKSPSLYLPPIQHWRAEVRLRPGRAEDAEACGRICYDAFAAIADAHNFPPDFPSPEIATDVLRSMLGRPGVFSVVAERGGRAIGSNFLDCRDAVAGVGPISIDPAVQDEGVGRRLMEAVHRHAEERGIGRVRLVQSAYHRRSLALYAKLGYAVREPLACLKGPALRVPVLGRSVRPARREDFAACNRLADAVLGHARGGELAEAIAAGTARVVERKGRIAGYATLVGFLGHAVGDTNADLMALIGAAEEFAGPGLLIPMRNEELFRSALNAGLRVVQTMTLMTRGVYVEPAGPYLPSVLY